MIKYRLTLIITLFLIFCMMPTDLNHYFILLFIVLKVELKVISLCSLLCIIENWCINGWIQGDFSQLLEKKKTYFSKNSKSISQHMTFIEICHDAAKNLSWQLLNSSSLISAPQQIYDGARLLTKNLRHFIP